ncbi:MAG: UbiA family prenyltransferase [Planctomycetaceae bacterium]|jgi:4-hydroxybenzoate polyprenyltransferase
MLNWLQLLRLPTVFTALADVLCGFFLGAALQSSGGTNWLALAWLMASSAGLYLGGMVLNDVFDVRLDAVERPERPIPGNRITLRAAAAVGGLLMAAGLVAATCAWIVSGHAGHSLLTAGIIAVAVLSYDAVLKATWAGPFGMATCRFLNLSLGASTAIDQTGSVVSWQQPVLGASLGLAVYIVGVTWFARNEAGQASVFGLAGGLVAAVVGIGLSAAATLWSQPDRAITTWGLVQFGVIMVVTVVRGAAAIRNGQSPVLQRTVGKMLLWIIMLDAAAVFAVTGNLIAEGVILLLVVPAIVLRRHIPMS